MSKKRAAFLSIFILLAINVISLSKVIEGYYGKEYEHVYTFMTVALISTILASIAFFAWKKEEYKN